MQKQKHEKDVKKKYRFKSRNIILGKKETKGNKKK